jgi:hypothetical protein
MQLKNLTTERSTQKVNVKALYHNRKPDTTKKIREEFTLKNSTVFGGYNLLADFIKSKRLEAILGECVDIQKAEWSTYDFPFVLRCLIDGYILGMERTKHFEMLEYKNLITEKLGVEKLPDYTVLNKDIKRFKDETGIKGLKATGIRLIRKRLKNKRDNIVYDFDSTVEIVYGEQEGAACGYNPKKPGRLSYHPLICFEATEDLHIDSILRRGDVHTSMGSVEFMEKVDEIMGSIVKRYKKLKQKGKVLARFDEGFDSEENYKKAEELGWGYVGKIRCFDPLKLNIFGIKRWRKIIGGSREIEVASITYKAGRWSKGRRVVIVRWQDDGGTQGSFFDELNYNYVAFVTNLNWAEEDIYGFYNSRGTVENRIKEAKYGFGIDKIPTGEFYANYAVLHLKMIAYNLVSAFQTEVMEMGSIRMSIRSIRKKFFQIAGKLIERGRQKVLKLAEDYLYKDWYLRMRERLSEL